MDARVLAIARVMVVARDQILSTQSRPQKFTRAALGRKVAHSYDYLRRPGKFPISFLLMKEMLESDHDYQ
ncbi:hypothetical protein, partial [Pseudomonas syringae group genomosp. 7]|uniref:hypothetical protein n=1 Tax=Pseudomonas syringae group genomosp. 7 TaxID=251699 RepID=UPI00376FF60C